MSQIISVELTDTEYKILELVKDNPANSLEITIKDQLDKTTNEVKEVVLTHCFDKKLPIPTTIEELVAKGFEYEILITAADRKLKAAAAKAELEKKNAAEMDAILKGENPDEVGASLGTNA